MLRRAAVLAPAVALAITTALPAAVSADEDYKYSTNGGCGSNGERAVGVVEIGAGGQVVGYVDDRNYLDANGLWIYLETNGIKRLQRGGDAASAPVGSKDICQTDRYDTEPVLQEGQKPDQLIW